MDKITEIRIEEVLMKKITNTIIGFIISKNGEVKIIGKSSVKPQCYKQMSTVK